MCACSTFSWLCESFIFAHIRSNLSILFGSCMRCECIGELNICDARPHWFRLSNTNDVVPCSQCWKVSNTTFLVMCFLLLCAYEHACRGHAMLSRSITNACVCSWISTTILLKLSFQFLQREEKRKKEMCIRS